GSGNTVMNTTLTLISDNSTVTSGSGYSVSLQATDTSTITAAAGSAALGVAGGEGGGTSATASFSLAVNGISNSVTASIDGSTVSSGGGVNLSALAQETIVAITAAGGVAGSAGAGDGLSFAGAGTATVNTIRNNVMAQIVGESHVT